LIDVACFDVDVGSGLVRLGTVVCRRTDGAVSGARRPYVVAVVCQAASVAARQQPQQLRTNGITAHSTTSHHPHHSAVVMLTLWPWHCHCQSPKWPPSSSADKPPIQHTIPQCRPTMSANGAYGEMFT